MYCPNCGGASAAGLRFCKSCGTNLEVVSQALTGQPAPPPQVSAPLFDAGQYCNVTAGGFKSIGLGIAFFLAAIVFAFSARRGGWSWTVFGFLIASGALVSKGVAGLLTAKKLEQIAGLHPAQQTLYVPPASPQAMRTQPLSAGGSVTDQTTKHLESASKL